MSSKANLKSLLKIVDNAQASIARFDKYQGEKLHDSDAFIKYMTKSLSETLDDIDNFEFIVKRAIRSIDSANNEQFAKKINEFMEYLYSGKMTQELFDDMKLQLKAFFRVEYAKDTKTFGSLLLNEGQNFISFLRSMITFLDVRSKELRELEKGE